jgi:hypothetical protein
MASFNQFWPWPAVHDGRPGPMPGFTIWFAPLLHRSLHSHWRSWFGYAYRWFCHWTRGLGHLWYILVLLNYVKLLKQPFLDTGFDPSHSSSVSKLDHVDYSDCKSLVALSHSVNIVFLWDVGQAWSTNQCPWGSKNIPTVHSLATSQCLPQFCWITPQKIDAFFSFFPSSIMGQSLRELVTWWVGELSLSLWLTSGMSHWGYYFQCVPRPGSLNSLRLLPWF